MSDILDWLLDALKAIMEFCLAVLPDSPFQFLDNSPIAPYLGYINYFIPLDFIIGTLQLWLVAVGIYYIYSAYLRWVKLVK